jgi:hypothetical protein
MTTKFKFLFASLALASITTLSAQTVGYVSTNITNSVNFISLGFEGTSTVTGTIDSAGTSTLTDTGAFGPVTLPSVVRITSGAGEGLVFNILSKDSNTLTVANNSVPNISAIVTSGNSYVVYGAQTLNSYFGLTSFTKASTSSVADNVLIYNGVTWVTYYFDTDDNFWRTTASATDAGGTVLVPNQAFLFVRKNTSLPLTLLTSGTVIDTKAGSYFPVSGLFVLGNQIPTNSTLGTIGLQLNAGWKRRNGSTSFAQADQVFIWNGVAYINAAYNDLTSRWENSGGTDVSSTAINAATGLLVSRKGNGTAFTFTQEL